MRKFSTVWETRLGLARTTSGFQWARSSAPKRFEAKSKLAAPCSSLQGFLSSATSASFAEMSAVSRTLQFSGTVSALVCKALFLNSYCFRILRRRLFEYLEQVVAECFARSARSHDTALKSTCAGLCWQDEGFFDFERIDEKALPIMSLKSSARCVIMSYFYVSSNDYMSSIGIYARCE